MAKRVVWRLREVGMLLPPSGRSRELSGEAVSHDTDKSKELEKQKPIWQDPSKEVAKIFDGATKTGILNQSRSTGRRPQGQGFTRRFNNMHEQNSIIEPNNPYALFCRGEIRFRLEQYNNILNDLSKSLKIETDFVSTLILCGTAYCKLGYVSIKLFINNSSCGLSRVAKINR
ncbi:hypothetical protein C2G38_2201571 [Gigaspora rosea]|uniref:Uncharacterized protein n=1 Tax=Gigaspora rosea TaxID=44941 RepID=A0A397UR76_9GLOM|nr:hypothetical protein C2G38_2201571 [Gigaspora rosea]